MKLKKICFVDNKGNENCIERIGHPPRCIEIHQEVINKGD